MARGSSRRDGRPRAAAIAALLASLACSDETWVVPIDPALGEWLALARVSESGEIHERRLFRFEGEPLVTGFGAPDGHDLAVFQLSPELFTELAGRPPEASRLDAATLTGGACGRCMAGAQGAPSLVLPGDRCPLPANAPGALRLGSPWDASRLDAIRERLELGWPGACACELPGPPVTPPPPPRLRRASHPDAPWPAPVLALRGDGELAAFGAQRQYRVSAAGQILAEIDAPFDRPPTRALALPDGFLVASEQLDGDSRLTRLSDALAPTGTLDSVMHSVEALLVDAPSGRVAIGGQRSARARQPPSLASCSFGGGEGRCAELMPTTPPLGESTIYSLASTPSGVVLGFGRRDALVAVERLPDPARVASVEVRDELSGTIVVGGEPSVAWAAVRIPRDIAGSELGLIDGFDGLDPRLRLGLPSDTRSLVVLDSGRYFYCAPAAAEPGSSPALLVFTGSISLEQVRSGRLPRPQVAYCELGAHRCGGYVEVEPSAATLLIAGHGVVRLDDASVGSTCCRDRPAPLPAHLEGVERVERTRSASIAVDERGQLRTLGGEARFGVVEGEPLTAAASSGGTLAAFSRAEMLAIRDGEPERLALTLPGAPTVAAGDDTGRFLVVGEGWARTIDARGGALERPAPPDGLHAAAWVSGEAWLAITDDEAYVSTPTSWLRVEISWDDPATPSVEEAAPCLRSVDARLGVGWVGTCDLSALQVFAHTSPPSARRVAIARPTQKQAEAIPPTRPIEVIDVSCPDVALAGTAYRAGNPAALFWSLAPGPSVEDWPHAQRRGVVRAVGAPVALATRPFTQAVFGLPRGAYVEVYPGAARAATSVRPRSVAIDERGRALIVGVDGRALIAEYPER